MYSTNMMQNMKSFVLMFSMFVWHNRIDTLEIRNFTSITKYPSNNIRSGGYPKFPSTIHTFTSSSNTGVGNKYYHGFYFPQKRPDFYPINRNTCGTRTVDFNPKRHPKIIGGNVAPYGAFPWQVEIQIFNYERAIFEHHCGAAVIGERVILTAAHCTEVSQQPYLQIVTGNHDLQKFDLYERRFRIEKIIMHPEFRRNGPYSNDISIIKVASNNDIGISFNTHVKPICLPKYDEVSQPGTWCSVTGWGAQIPEDNNSLARILRVANVPVLSLETCRMSDVNGGRSQSILDTMICAGLLQGGIDACNGDSGGPLACEYNDKFFLAGIVSWGDGCAKKNRPGVYTRVGAYIDWIEKTMKRLDTY